MKPSEILKKAWALIEDPARWTQHTAARDNNGQPACAYDTDAVQWCALGAAWKAAVDNRVGSHILKAAECWLAFAAATCTVASVNDSLGHSAVRDMYLKAIELAEAEESKL